MANNPLAAGIGTGTAQVFDTSKSEGVYHAQQEQLRKKKAEEDKKADLAAAEARGELDKLSDKKLWYMRDSDYMHDTWNQIHDKYSGRWAQMAKDPKLRAEYEKDVAQFKKEANDSMAMKEIYNQLRPQFENAEWTKHRSPEQQAMFHSILKKPGQKWTNEDINYMTKPTVDLPNPLKRATDLVKFSQHLTSDQSQWGAASGARGGKSTTSLNIEKWKNAVRAQLGVDELLQSSVEKEYGDLSDEANVNRFLEEAAAQYSSEKESTSYFAPKPDDDGTKFDKSKIVDYSDEPESVRSYLGPQFTLEAGAFGDTDVGEKYGNIPTYGTYDFGKKQQTTVVMGDSFKPLSEGAAVQTGQRNVTLGNPMLVPVNNAGEMVEESTNYQWVIPMSYGSDTEGLGGKTVYATVDDFLKTNASYKRTYMGNLTGAKSDPKDFFKSPEGTQTGGTPPGGNAR